MIKYSFSFCVLSIATLLSVSSVATASTSLPDISAEQIALDIDRRLNEKTGAVEYYAPTFDPFESVDQIAGTVSLRSNTRTTGIDGHIVRGGAILDVNFFYTTDSDDPYDVAGFESAVFFSGEDVNATYYDNRIIECSENITEVVYHQDYYHGASYGLIGGLYRPFPIYRGHSLYGFRGLNYGWTFPVGFTSRSRLNRSSRSNRFSTRTRSNNFNSRSRVNTPRRFNDRDNRSDRGVRRVRRDNDDRRNRSVRRNNDDSSRDIARRSNRNIVRSRNDNNNQTIRENNGRTLQRGIRTIKGQESRSSQRRSSVRRAPNQARARVASPTGERNRSITSNAASETVRKPTRSLSSSAPKTRQSAPRKQTVKSSDSKPSRSQSSRTPSRSSEKQTKKTTSKPKRASSKSQQKSSSRSSGRSVSKSTNRSFRSSNPRRNKRKHNFFPQAFLLGGSSYGAGSVAVSHKCAREEALSLHISRDHLEAARYEGLTVFVIDRLGQDIPIYIPPNYIEGFTSTAFGPSRSYQEPQSYQEPPTYQDPSFQQPNGPLPQDPSLQPRIYGDPSGGYPQNDGF